MSKGKGWIGVDLDGTLAMYDNFKGPDVIGAPIQNMVARVQRWLAAGHEVRIFTARVSHDGTALRMHDADRARYAIRAWCVEHIGAPLVVTNEKDWNMIELWGDRCVQVEANTGLQVGTSTRGLDL